VLFPSDAQTRRKQRSVERAVEAPRLNGGGDNVVEEPFRLTVAAVLERQLDPREAFLDAQAARRNVLVEVEPRRIDRRPPRQSQLERDAFRLKRKPAYSCNGDRLVQPMVITHSGDRDHLQHVAL
jgi:hypothetical protein